ncbi:MAG: TRAP transporter small permease [Cellvibrionaceae bacterium]
MRKQLDRLYYVSALAGGCCLIAMTLLILAQIVGRWFGVIVPSTEDFSGFLLASSFSLCLGYTFRFGGLIRVSLLISHLGESKRFLTEVACMTLMVVLCGYLIWYFGYTVYESYDFNEVTTGYVVIHLWIPQLPVFIGILVFGIAVFDDFLKLITTRNPAYRQNEHSEEAGVAE